MTTFRATHRRPQRVASLQRERGSIIVNASIALSVLVILVLGLELGAAHYQKRSLQKAADMAALAGANDLNPVQCDALVHKTVQQTVSANTGLDATVLTECGQWVAPASSEESAVDGFSVTQGQDYNAIRVRLDAPVGLFAGAGLFTSGLRETATAVATRSEPQARFSVGAQLLRTNQNSLLVKILQGLGVSPDDLRVLDASGLATIKTTPAGILHALGLNVQLDAGVLTPEALAEVRTVSVEEILDVALELVSQNSTLHAGLDLLQTELLDTALQNVQIAMFSTGSSRGLLSLDLANGGADPAALDTKIDLGLLLKTALGIATSGRSVTVPQLNLLGLVDVQAGIVEPPSIGIGGIGTRAYNAQVRLYLDVDSDKLLGGSLSPLLNGLLGTRIHLPMYIDVVNGFGELTELSCQAPLPQAKIEVTSSLLRTCVGGLDDPSVRFSTRNLCEDKLQDERLVKLLHLATPGATQFQIDALHQTEPVALEVGQTKSTAENKLQIGGLVSALVDSLLRFLGSLLNTTELSNAKKAEALADSYLNSTKDAKGFYKPNAVIDLLQNGDPSTGLPPLKTWNRTIMVQDPVLGLFPQQRTLSVWDVLRLYTTPSGGLLGLVGVGQSCASLLQSLLAWNPCVRSKVVEALNSAPDSILDDAAGWLENQLPDQLPGSSSASGSGANGFLNLLLSPIVSAVEGILNGLGSLLAGTLKDVLGLELGRTDVTLHEIECGRSRLVY